jgi:histidine triad (HIT) family protein
VNHPEDVLSGNLPVRKVWEDDRVLAFHHPTPRAEIHVVIVPKQHVPSLLAPQALDGLLLSSMVRAVPAVVRALALEGRGFQLQVNAAAPGVTPHRHWHVLGPGIP